MRVNGNLWVRVTSALLGLAALLAGSGCGRQTEAAAPQADSVPEVQTARPTRQALPRLVEQPGRIEAYEETPLFAKIAGYAKEVRVEIGARVKKGDVLA